MGAYLIVFTLILSTATCNNNKKHFVACKESQIKEKNKKRGVDTP